jgi:metallophosphoesterase (TIGR00282 family)
MPIRIVMLGDIVGRPGRQAVAQQVPAIRERWKPDLILANAENVTNGSGLTPEHYQKIRDSGVDAMTLGDHAYRKMQIVETLESKPDIIRPANLPQGAKGKGWMKIPFPASSAAAGRSLFVVTVLGRIFMNLPADDPFAAVENMLRQVTEKDPIVLLEIHAEATSEKQAIGWQFNGRVAAVVGTHTHVPTADARILSEGTAYITDLGMCGPQESILGREIDKVLTHMLTAMPAPFDVAEGDPRVCGVMIEINEKTGRATAIERIELKANPNAPPFTAT